MRTYLITFRNAMGNYCEYRTEAESWVDALSDFLIGLDIEFFNLNIRTIKQKECVK